MDVRNIQPFIDATGEVFATMLECQPKMGKIRLPSPADKTSNVTAVIGLSGTVRGACSLSFPPGTGTQIARRILHTEDALADAEIIDALGEVANMVAGCAKAKIVGGDIAIGLPTIIRGENYVLEHPTGSVTLVVPFESPLGAFQLNVTFARGAAPPA